MSRNVFRESACAEAMEALRSRWVDGKHNDGDSDPASHVESCPACRRMAEEIELLDVHVARGLGYLGSLAESPPGERVDEIIRRIREEQLDTTLIRRVRRPIRILLWIAFYSFTLLAAFVLATAVYRALQ
jgi:hypothetical protein